MSSFVQTREVRPAQYRSTRSAGSSRLAAAQYVTTSPEPPGTPAGRSARPNPTSTPANAVCSATGGELLELVEHQIEVVLVLDDGADGVGRGTGAEVGLAQEPERGAPVDRLGHSRRLGQIELAQPVHRGGGPRA